MLRQEEVVRLRRYLAEQPDHETRVAVEKLASRESKMLRALLAERLDSQGVSRRGWV